jgi:hypothetical protein
VKVVVMNPEFRSGGGWQGENNQRNDPPSDSDGGTSNSEPPSPKLEQHMKRNASFFSSKFTRYEVCPDRKILYKYEDGVKKPLHASRVNKYHYNTPRAYRTETPDSIIDMAVSADEMLEFFEQFDSILPWSAFEAKLDEISKSFDRIFKLTADPAGYKSAIGNVESEVEFRDRLIAFLRKIGDIVGGEGYTLPIALEKMCSVGGLACKLKEGTCEVNLDAGILTFTDLRIPFGHPKYKGKIFFICELKRNQGKGQDGNPLPPRWLREFWYREGKALFTQLHAGLLGEAARLGLAVMPEGFKVVIVRDVQGTEPQEMCPSSDTEQGQEWKQEKEERELGQEVEHEVAHGVQRHGNSKKKFRFGWFPSDGLRYPKGLCDYTKPDNKFFFCYIAAQIVRVGLTKEEDSASEKEGTFSAWVCKGPLRRALGSERSPPPKRQRTDDPETAKKIHSRSKEEIEELENQHRQCSSPRNTAYAFEDPPAPSKDELLTFVAADGSLVRFARIDVSSRYSATDIDEQHRIHYGIKRAADANLSEEVDS